MSLCRHRHLSAPADWQLRLLRRPFRARPFGPT